MCMCVCAKHSVTYLRCTKARALVNSKSNNLNPAILDSRLINYSNENYANDCTQFKTLSKYSNYFTQMLILSAEII